MVVSRFVLHLTALLDGDAQFRFRIRTDRYVLDLAQHQHSVQYSSENHVLWDGERTS